MLRRQPPSVPQVAPTRHLGQRLPHRVEEIVLERQMLEAIGALLEVRQSRGRAAQPAIAGACGARWKRAKRAADKSTHSQFFCGNRGMDSASRLSAEARARLAIP